MDPGHMSAGPYAFFVNGFPYPNAFPPASAATYTSVATGQSRVTPHCNVPRSYLAPEMYHGEQVRRPSNPQPKETPENNKDYQAAVHRQAMMNYFPTVATHGGICSPSVPPRQLAPPSYASVQPSENEQLKRQIEERTKALAQTDEELKATAKRAALTDAKATSAVASAKDKNQQLMEDIERAKERAETLKKELDEKDALIEELRKENAAILRRMQQEQKEAPTDNAECDNEEEDELSTKQMPFIYGGEQNPNFGASGADGSAYQAAYASHPAQATYVPHNYANYRQYPAPSPRL